MKSNNNEIEQISKPNILTLTNGPYYLINNMEAKVVDNLQNSKGEPLSTISGVALCRCGGSKNKPFCDGTHSIIGFSSANKTLNDNDKAIRDKRRDYIGKEITIHDNRKICSHAAECVKDLPSVFKLGNKPWIDPNGTET
jgi:CDGSH-type Zn-finger protein